MGEIYFDVKIRRPHSIFDMMGSMFGGAGGGGGDDVTLQQQIAPGAVDLD